MLGVPVAGSLASCATPGDPTAGLYHQGELSIGTGNTTGTFYALGAGFANVINRHLSGYEAVATPTAGSGENVSRLGNGDIDLALAFADNAADAFRGTGTFAAGKVPLRALARLNSSYMHMIARVDRGIHSVDEVRGHRVSTASANSGSEGLCLRMLAVSGIDPAKDITGLSQSLPQSVAALASGGIDAMFYAGGIPVTGVADLLSKAGQAVRILPCDSLIPALSKKYGDGVYASSVIPRATYNLAADVPTIAVPTVLVVSPSMPDDLAYNLTKLIFQYQAELITLHPEAKNIKRESAPNTQPVPLHPGAQRYYSGG
jgi:TRAP transporter TAXI family solute receptor